MYSNESRYLQYAIPRNHLVSNNENIQHLLSFCPGVRESTFIILLLDG